ncbi:MAG: PilZ domain-containing protein [Bryobacteraceae bacterium]
MTESEAKSAVIESDERRGEQRFNATGEVHLLIGGPQALSIRGRILDVSEHGMRVEHMYPALTSGLMLQIESGSTQYTARVVWNRIKDDTVESGFYLL